MKGEKLLSFFLAVILSCLLSIGAVGCLVTGFGLHSEDLQGVLRLCVWLSLAGSALLLWKWGGALLAFLLALTGGLFWYRGIPTEQFLSLIRDISYVYHSAYNWGYLDFGVSGAAADWPLALMGGIIALSACRTVCRGKGAIFTVILAAAPLAACMVVTDTVPDKTYLFCLLLCLILLILSGGVRTDNAHQGNRLTAMAAIPVVLALAGLFLAVPQDGYVNHSKEVQSKLLSYVEHLPQFVETTMTEVATNVQGSDPKNVDLKSLGARPRYTHAVMDVTTETGGILYLRGQDYDSYSGTGWTTSAHRLEKFFCDGNSAGDVTVRTRSRKDILYLPYYPREGVTLTGGKTANSEHVREYAFTRIVLPENWKDRTAENPATNDGEIFLTLEVQAFGSTAERLRYLTLPGETDIQAKALLQNILPENGSRVEQAEAIAEYVRNSATYDLNTGRMPAEEEDFALWFLQESDTGYCVHFATAAVVLLRAADIPARYVTGYMVETEAGQITRVTAGNAHAWAEYYVPQIGTWVVLEATPADPNAAEMTEATEQTTEASEPEETEISTLPHSSDTAPPAPDATETPELPEESDSGFHGWWLLILAAAAALIPVQRSLRLSLRKKRLHSGDANTQALARWQEAERLAKLLKEEAPAALFDLAQKAKFSQHTLTDDELLQFDAFLHSSRRQLRKRPWYWQVLYRYIYVVY